jgi:hypothetical protein
MTRSLFFLLCCWLGMSTATCAQDTTRPAPAIPAPQAARDSIDTAKPAISSPTLVHKEENPATISKQDWITSGIALFAALVAFASLVLSWVLYQKNTTLAEQRRAAELRAEEESRKRTALEERKRQIDDLKARHEFEQQQEQEGKNQKAKTAEESYLHTLKTEVCQLYLAAPGIERVQVSLDDAFVHLNLAEHEHSREFPLYGDPERARGKHEDLSPKDVLSRVFQDYNRRLLLVIGDPGSGKTTLLKYYAMCCCQPGGFQQLGFTRPVFPFYLPLLEVDCTKSPAGSLASNLARWANKHDLEIRPEEFHAWLH